MTKTTMYHVFIYATLYKKTDENVKEAMWVELWVSPEDRPVVLK